MILFSINCINLLKPPTRSSLPLHLQWRRIHHIIRISSGGFPAAPSLLHSTRVPRPGPLCPPLVLWGLAGAFVVPRGCMGAVPGTHQLNPVVREYKMGYQLGRTIRTPSTGAQENFNSGGCGVRIN